MKKKIKIKSFHDLGDKILLNDYEGDTYSFFKARQDKEPTSAYYVWSRIKDHKDVEINVDYKEREYNGKIYKNVIGLGGEHTIFNYEEKIKKDKQIREGVINELNNK